MEPLPRPPEEVLRNVRQVYWREQDEDTLRQKVQDAKPSLAKRAGGYRTTRLCIPEVLRPQIQETPEIQEVL